MYNDLSMREAITDELIARVNAADGTDEQSFALLLESVALRLAAEEGKDSSEDLVISTADRHIAKPTLSRAPHEAFWSFSNQLLPDDLSPFPNA
ncbi:hypothetical protein AAIH70_15935 [Neorhizobium sp. BT27B]|uniref:hypothetical protein n=1 Tax=Neorhizobium sp. BT27B TaxID=3142625 RepID=UPI003D2D09B7